MGGVLIICVILNDLSSKWKQLQLIVWLRDKRADPVCLAMWEECGPTLVTRERRGVLQSAHSIFCNT